jgi:hypothetical protein
MVNVAFCGTQTPALLLVVISVPRRQIHQPQAFVGQDDDDLFQQRWRVLRPRRDRTPTLDLSAEFVDALSSSALAAS